MVFIKTTKNPITFKKNPVLRRIETSLGEFIHRFVSWSVSEFKQLKPHRWTTKNRFQLSAGSNFEKLTKILGGTIHVWIFQIRSLGIVIIRFFNFQDI